MAFTGGEDHEITLSEAEGLIKNFQDNAPENSVKGHFFGKDFLRQVLDQEGCVGIRVYYAETDAGASTVVIVGADANENDMTGGYLGNKSKPCPPNCGTLGFLEG
jgi:hypothetical protein